MNQMSTVGTQWGVFNQNKVTLEGGDASRMNLIFKGTIGIAFVDANAQPEVCFRFNAVAAGYESVSPIDPTSNETDTDVVQTLQQIATKAGLGFENNGVNAKIGPQYLSGSALRANQSSLRRRRHHVDYREQYACDLDSGTGQKRRGGSHFSANRNDRLSRVLDEFDHRANAV